MAYNFPNSPSNGDTVTVNGVVYTYNSTDNAWKSGTGSGPAILSDGSTPSLASGITASEIRTLIGADDLTSVSSDIIPDGNETRDFTAWCWKCFWCYEKAWAFNLPRTHNA